MIKGNIGTVTIGTKTILVGSNHLVVSYPVKDDLEGVVIGAAVKLNDGKVEHIAADTDDAIGVVYQGVAGKTKDATVSVVVFGAVKKNEVVFTKDATACTQQLVEKLRKNGVYAIN